MCFLYLTNFYIHLNINININPTEGIYEALVYLFCRITQIKTCGVIHGTHFPIFSLNSSRPKIYHYNLSFKVKEEFTHNLGQ